MTTNIGTSTSFQAIVPDLTDTADIQVALRLLSYGVSLDPANNAAIGTNSVFGKIRDLTTLTNTKANTASPTFTGNVTLPTGTNAVAPLKFVSGVNLTTPVVGSMEYDGKALSYTTSTNTGRGIVPTSYYFTYYGNSAYLGGATSPHGYKRITLEPNTAYEVEGMYAFTFNEAGVGGGIVSSYPIFKIQGTATVANSPIDVVYWCASNSGLSTLTAARTIRETYVVGNTDIPLENTTASTAGRSGVVKWKGIVRNQQSSAGTFFATILPNTLAVNVSIKDGSYMKVTPIGVDTVAGTGGWF